MANTVVPSSGSGDSLLKVNIEAVSIDTTSELIATNDYDQSDSVLFIQKEEKPVPYGGLIPICDEVIVTTAADNINYNIYKNGDNIFTGKAYKFPGDTTIDVELNDVISDYMSNNIDFRFGLRVMDDYLNTFTTSINNSQFRVFNAWKRPESLILNDPISNVIDTRQYYWINYLDPDGNLTLYRDGGEIGSLSSVDGCVYVPPRATIRCGENYHFEIKTGNVVVDEITYYFDHTNKDYALYYVNAYGGWDSLLLKGNGTQIDNINSKTYKNKTNGTVKYLNITTPTWQLYTGDMNNGLKMHHLLESNEVYLHNLKTDELIKVNITDSTCEYKTYANQGNSRFYYVIKVEAANYEIRK